MTDAAIPILSRFMKHAFAAPVLLLLAACVSSRPPYVTVNGLSGRMTAIHDYFPLAMRRSGVSGLVSLRYSVSPAGIPVRIVVTSANERAFAGAAVDFLRDWRFIVPANWAAAGGPQRRFNARVKFLVAREIPVEKWNPDDPLFTITGY